jgi:CheY-like chemotaxis protein
MPTATPANAPLILLVDDHADTVGLMARVLRKQGFEALKADSVATALAAAAGDRPIDLLVSDLTLPDGSGHDLMRQLRQSRPRLRGIAVSGHGSDEDRAASLAAGFARHVVKPVDFPSFVQLCRDVLEGR